VIFSATDEDNAEEFVLFFHPQNQQAGLLVDISSSAGYFLSMDNENYIVANSSDVPADKFKFLIIPVEEWW
jgi:murein tripeptide amidase MpaA